MANNDFDQQMMQHALQLAEQARQIGEVPVGAVVVRDGKIVGQGFNRRESDRDPLAHAELIALKEASKKLNRWRLSGCALYVTIEPCAMCAGALVNARVDRLIFGAHDKKAGAVKSLMNICTHSGLNHFIEVSSGLLEQECSAILSGFFQGLRNRKKTGNKLVGALTSHDYVPSF